jgi:hypothetical protein
LPSDLHPFLVRPYQRDNFKMVSPPKLGRRHKMAHTKEEKPKNGFSFLSKY